MILRERLADWISGGALTDARLAEDVSANLAKIYYADVTLLSGQGDTMRHAIQAALACETPGANATVRRMARILRKAVQ